MKVDPSVEEYIEKHPNWQKELEQFRMLIRPTELTESIKWSRPVYALNKKNVIGLAAFKNHCSLIFFQGALLEKNTALLQNAEEGKTKAMRQIRFQKGDKIDLNALSKYISEAIQNQKEGKEILPNRQNKKLVIPKELLEVFHQNPKLEKSFKELTPGRQREYGEYIDSAKRESTKWKRIEKITPIILSGKGLNDKYH